MKQYQAYFFDLYGTLVDIHTDESKAKFWKTVASCYASHGADYDPASLRAEYSALCGAEAARLQKKHPYAAVEIDLLRVFRALYKEKGVRPGKALLADTAWAFRQASTTRLRAYPGAGGLLAALRLTGKKVILLSNAQSCFTRRELDTLGLTSRFNHIFVSSEAGFQKPDLRFFSAALRELELNPADCLMVGNDPVCDVDGAVSVGMDAVYLHTPQSPADAPDVHPKAILSYQGTDLRRLRSILLRWD